MRHRTASAWYLDQFYDAGNSYNAIFCIDDNNGWAVGTYGVIIHTVNGINWNGQTNPDAQKQQLNDIFHSHLRPSGPTKAGRRPGKYPGSGIPPLKLSE